VSSGNDNLTVLGVSQNHRIISGADRYFFSLNELLEGHGHRVIPFTSSHPEDLPSPYSSHFPPGPDYENPGIGDAVRHVFSPRARKSLQGLLGGVEPDLAHLHLYYGKLTSSILAPLRSRGIPIVQTMHDFKLVCPVATLMSNGEICEACQGHAFWNATRKRCNRGSLLRSVGSTVESYVSRSMGDERHIDHFLSVSDFVKNKLVQLGISASKITTIYPFIEAKTVVPAEGAGDLVLFVGRLERVKGVFTLLEAVRDLRDIEVAYVGRGGDSAELERTISDYGLDHVRVLGFKAGADLDALMRRAMFVVSPSELYEASGMILFETFAYGRPIVGSRIGGIPEIVTDGVDGLLVPPSDPESLGEAIETLARDEARRAEMGAKGREKVETVLGPEEHYRQMSAIYAGLVG